jgi:hypothetical protein
MASKWAHLKGKVPERAPTARDVGLAEELKKIEETTIDVLTDEYNALWKESDDLAALAKANKLKMDAREIMIRKRLAAKGIDGAMVNGYTWTEKFEPYPVCEDPAAIVEYFRTHEMEDQLVLTNTELANRLKTFVKDEAARGELQIITIPGENGEEDRTEVRSSVPGVKVFLKADLSRVKSSKKE